MPLYSEHISNMYFGGSPSYTGLPYSYGSSVSPLGSSYSASYLNPGGSYSTHSSLGSYSRTPLSSRWISSAGRNYSPMLSTISERGTASPVRINSPRRIPISKRTYGTPTYTPRPININTADIDVSKDRYRRKSDEIPTISPKTSPRYESPKTSPRHESPKTSPKNESPKIETGDKENGPFMPRVDGKPETGIDSSPGLRRSTIKRGRTVVRLHTIKRRERDSPRKPAEDSSNQDATSNDDNGDVAADDSEMQENLENLSWREKLSDDLIYKGKKEKKSIGTKLVEKFIIKNDEDDNDAVTENTITPKATSQSLPSTPLPTVSNIETSKSPDRRCSMELLAEQASLFDSLIRRENLSTTSLDLSKVGISDTSEDSIEKIQQVKKRKGNDPENPLKTTKSDHSLHNSLKNFRDPKDMRQLSKRRSLKKSSSGGSICRLDSITEFPKELSRQDLPSIEESRLSVKNENPKPKPKLKPVITSSVDVSPPKSPLKFKVENVTVEEIPCTPKKEIIFTSAIEDVPPKKEVSAYTPLRNAKNRRSMKKKVKPAGAKADDLSPEPDDGNFWDKIGKRETVYLMKRKQYIDDAREKHRRALFWFPEDEESSTCEESQSIEKMEDIPSDGQAHQSLLNCDIFGSNDNEPTIQVNENNQEITKKPELESVSIATAPEKVGVDKITSLIESQLNDIENVNHVVEKEASEKLEECAQLSKADKIITETNVPLLEPTKKEIKNELPSLVPNQSKESKHADSCRTIITQEEPIKKIDNKSDIKQPIPSQSETSNLQTPASQESEEETKQAVESDNKQALKDNPSVDIVEKPLVAEKSNMNIPSSQESVVEVNQTVNNQHTSEVPISKTEPPKSIQSEKKEEPLVKLETKADVVKISNITEDPVKKTIANEKISTSTKVKVEVKTASSDTVAKLPQTKVKTKEESQPTKIVKPKSITNKNKALETKPNENKEITKKANIKEVPSGPQKLSTLAKSAKTPEKTEVPKLVCTQLKQKKEEQSSLKKKIEAAPSNNVTLDIKPIPDSTSKDVIAETVVAETNKLAVEVKPVLENIPHTKNEIEKEVTKPQEKSGEDKKAENVPEIQEQKIVDKQPVPEVAVKPLPSPRKPVKEEAAIRPLIATPRPLQKKVPQVIHSSSSSESSSEESSDEDDADESDASEDSTEFYECENHPDGRTSTGSNDSGFDSSAPTSPAGFVQIKKDCDVNCHRKCEKLTANLCGVNQRLLVEALASRPSFRKGADSPGTSAAQAQADAADVLEQELEQSTAYGLFRKTGRFTPPARSIPRFRKYAIEDFHFIKVLGKGSFGKVLLAELRDTEYYYAVKCLKKDVVLEDDDVECTLIERKVLALGTNHPYLCHLFATFQTDSHLFFVMEYLNGGDLMFHIQQSGRFPESRARFYAAEIVSGLKFLHKRGIVYRDLKLDNILLDFDGHVRIADFGMCKLQIYLDKTADTFCGTPDYMAPEIIKGLKYNQAVDWWSFGVLLYEMLIGQSPFSGCDEDELFWSICNEMPSYPRFLSQEALTILTRLLDKDARTRLGGAECMHGDVREQEFFHPVHWDRLERRDLDAPFKPRVRHPLDTQYFDRAFTGERPRLTAVEPHVLRSMDQEPFRGFSYTNPNATDR